MTRRDDNASTNPWLIWYNWNSIADKHWQNTSNHLFNNRNIRNAKIHAKSA